MVNVGYDAQLVCLVDSYPTPVGNAGTIKWKRSGGYDIKNRATVRTTPEGATLHIKNVTVADAGKFVCVANNGIPKSKPLEIEQEFFLLVRREYTRRSPRFSYKRVDL